VKDADFRFIPIGADDGHHTDYVAQWNVAVQQKLPYQFLVEAAYASVCHSQ
jgi:hypothetical protein